MRSCVLLFICMWFTLTAAGDTPQNSARFQFTRASVADDFVLLRCERKTGQVWNHNEEGKWQLLTKTPQAPSGDYSCVIAPYSTGGGRSPIASGVTAWTETWTIFRVDTQTGRTWRYINGSFKEFGEHSRNEAPRRGEFRLVCEGIGRGFAIYRYEIKTASIWRLDSFEWIEIASDTVPESEYLYKIIPTRRFAEHRLFRFNQKTGEAWELQDDEFILVDTAESSID